MPRTRRPAILGSALVVLAFHGRQVIAAPRTWIEVKSPNFTVVSDAGEGGARSVAWQFEQARAAFTRLWSWARPRGGKPFVVFAARDESSLKALAPEYWEPKDAVRPVSVTVTGAAAHYLTLRVDADTPDDVRATPYFNLYRAYAGVLLSAAFDRPLPPWLRTGLGELYGNTRVREKEVGVGILVPWHIRTLRQYPPLTVAELLAVESKSAYSRHQDDSDRFYASSWVLVHYLMFGDNAARAQRLNDFVSLWERGQPQEAAFREAFGDPALVQKGLTSYLFQKALAYAKLAIDVSLEKERFPARTLTPAEAAAARAALHVAMGRPKEARALVDEAKAAPPVPAAAYDAEALLLDRADDDTGALPAYQKAADAGSTSFFTHYRLAQLLADRAGQDKEAHARVARTLERAKELNPDYAYTYSFLADEKAYLGSSDDALASARKAVEMEPGGAYHHLAMARVLSSLSRDEEAMASAARGRALADEDWEKREAERTIDYIGRVRASREAVASRVAATRPPIVVETAPAATGQAQTLALLSETCDAGDKRACLHAATLQLKAKTPGDEVKAIATLSALCDGGQKEACTMLALHHAGKPTARDQARARELLKKACDAGEPAACRALQSMPK